MDANVPKSQPPVLPGQAIAGWSTTQPMFDDEEDEMGLLWEVRVPDLSVLHSMPIGEPFSHEGNALFELLERFKQQQQQQQQQASAAKARRRSRRENAARAQKQVALPPGTATAGNISNTMNSSDSDDETSMTMDFLLDNPYDEGDEIDSSKANKF